MSGLMRYSLVCCLLLLATPVPGRPRVEEGGEGVDSGDRPENTVAGPGGSEEWTFFHNGREYSSESLRELKPQPTRPPGSQQPEIVYSVIINPELLERPRPGDAIGYRLRTGEKAAEEVGGVISDDNLLILDNGINIPVAGMNIYRIFVRIRSIHRRLRIPDYGFIR
jgi:hypothetical protein